MEEIKQEEGKKEKIKKKLPYIVAGILGVATLILTIEYISLTSQVDSLNKKVVKAKEQIKTLKDRLADVELEKSQLKKKYASLKDKMKNYETKLEDKYKCENLVAELGEKNEELSKELNILKIQYEAAREKIEEYEKNPLEKRVQMLVKQNNTLKNNLSSCFINLNKLKKDKEYYQSLYKNFRTQYEDCKKEYENVLYNYKNERKKTYFLDILKNKDKFKKYKVSVGNSNIIIKGYLDKDTGTFYGVVNNTKDLLNLLESMSNAMEKIQAVYKSPNEKYYLVVINGI